MKITVNGNEIHYMLEGPPSAPVVMLSHALATSMMIWEPQKALLARSFRLLLSDTLGHGGSSTPPGPYTLDQLAGQAGGLLDGLGIRSVHFLGVSMGGMIGQTLALARPELIASLILCDSASRVPPEARPLWDERIRIAQSEGMEPLVEPTIVRWFTAPYRQSKPEVVERVRKMIRETPPAGYAACCHAIANLDLADRIRAIKAPTLILVGEEDPGSPVSMSRAIHEQIAGSELRIIPAASHLANIEQHDIFNLAVTTFLKQHKDG